MGKENCQRAEMSGPKEDHIFPLGCERCDLALGVFIYYLQGLAAGNLSSSHCSTFPVSLADFFWKGM